MNALDTIYDHWNTKGDKECSGEDLNWGLSIGDDIYYLFWWFRSQLGKKLLDSFILKEETLV